MSEYRLRFAPSPTGPLHIGGARSALFNFLLAKKHGGTFIVRVEDTDLDRSSRESEENIKDSLRWLGITWDEGIDVGGAHGPYRQTERLALYEEATARLLAENKAYYCFCSEEELAAEREEQLARGETPRYGGKCRHLTEVQQQVQRDRGVEPVVRLRVPAGETVEIDDMVRGHVAFDTDGIGDFIIVKSDGIPVYNFAVVVDDATMEISHVIRGEEHLSNTPRQLVLYDALGYRRPAFGHVSLILGADRTKMSKRHGSTSVVAYREQGFLPEALVNFLALLGWAPPGEEEIFSLAELVDAFSLDRVSKSPAVFDLEKLKWLNGAYIRSAAQERLMEYAVPFLQRGGCIATTPSATEMSWANAVVTALKNHIQSFDELVPLIEQYRGPLRYDDEVLVHLQTAAETRQQAATVNRVMQEQLLAAGELTAESYRQCVKAVQKETGIKGRPLYHSLRMAATGSLQGPDLDKIAIILGKKLMLERIDAFLAFVATI